MSTDNFSSTLVSQLLEKTLENTSPADRLAFVAQLFAQLPPQGQQEFLLSLTRALLEAETPASQLKKAFDVEFIEPRLVNIYAPGNQDFAPGQICCQALTGFAKEEGMDEEQCVDVAQKFSGLADETRVKIVKLLAKGEFTVDELVDFLGEPQSTTSHHLRVLKDANLIKGEKRGRNTYYSLVKPEEVSVEAG
jgi:DNA-binding transcriptional ArsR family regulator